MERTVGITNYGPLPAVFYVNDNSHLKDDGILIRLKSRNELIVGANLSFSITFAPKKNNFKKQIEAVESVFYFEVCLIIVSNFNLRIVLYYIFY